MSNGVNFRNGSLMSTADLGGQRILGMSGSLTNYINTGVATSLDSYHPSSAKANSANKKPFDLMSAIKLGIVGLGAVALGLVFVKKGDIDKLKNKASKLFKKSVDSAKQVKKPDFSKMKAQAQNEMKDVKDAIDKSIIAPIKAQNAKKKTMQKSFFAFKSPSSANSKKFTFEKLKTKMQAKKDARASRPPKAKKSFFKGIKESFSALFSRFKRKAPDVVVETPTPSPDVAPRVIYLEPPKSQIAGYLPAPKVVEAPRSGIDVVPKYEDIFRNPNGRDYIDEKLTERLRQDYLAGKLPLPSYSASPKAIERAAETPVDVVSEVVDDIAQTSQSVRTSKKGKLNFKGWNPFSRHSAQNNDKKFKHFDFDYSNGSLRSIRFKPRKK